MFLRQQSSIINSISFKITNYNGKRHLRSNNPVIKGTFSKITDDNSWGHLLQNHRPLQSRASSSRQTIQSKPSSSKLQTTMVKGIFEPTIHNHRRHIHSIKLLWASSKLEATRIKDILFETTIHEHHRHLRSGPQSSHKAVSNQNNRYTHLPHNYNPSFPGPFPLKTTIIKGLFERESRRWHCLRNRTDSNLPTLN